MKTVTRIDIHFDSTNEKELNESKMFIEKKISEGFKSTAYNTDEEKNCFVSLMYAEISK